MIVHFHIREKMWVCAKVSIWTFNSVAVSPKTAMYLAVTIILLTLRSLTVLAKKSTPTAWCCNKTANNLLPVTIQALHWSVKQNTNKKTMKSVVVVRYCNSAIILHHSSVFEQHISAKLTGSIFSSQWTSTWARQRGLRSISAKGSSLPYLATKEWYLSKESAVYLSCLTRHKLFLKLC